MDEPNKFRNDDNRTGTEVQGHTIWRAPQGALGRLTASSRLRAAALLGDVARLESMIASAQPTPSMAAALATGKHVGVIAEIKRRSPSRGAINEDIDAPSRALVYAQAGAKAISVLTEPAEFGGSVTDLDGIRAITTVPLLKKDFHVEECQLAEARAHGASAALLIARAVAPRRLWDLANYAIGIGLEVLIEVRSEHELDSALATPARMIGVNARDLETLIVENEVVLRLLPKIPADRLAIAESGIATRADVERVAARGAVAVLVGSALSLAPDPGELMSRLSGVPRVATHA